MRNVYMSAILWFLLLGDLSAQDIKPVNNKQYMQITTVESVIAGGFGRSRMIITNADGTQKEFNLENLFSIAGINFRNIMDNETRILQTIREYTSNGWKIEQVTSLTLSPNDSGSGGIFMTRYLLSTADDKKAF
jgi:hypothetical protein